MVGVLGRKESRSRPERELVTRAEGRMSFEEIKIDMVYNVTWYCTRVRTVPGFALAY